VGKCAVVEEIGGFVVGIELKNEGFSEIVEEIERSTKKSRDLFKGIEWETRRFRTNSVARFDNTLENDHALTTFKTWTSP
jgi:hypothetical protein